MSFTVMRYKDGQPTPLRLSIWDAFKGVPRPQPRKQKPCSCCKRIHPRKVNESAGENTSYKGKKGDKNTAQTESKKTTFTDAQKQTYSDKPVDTYTSNDDAKIIELKAAQRPWKEILATVGKNSMSQLKEHWRTIDPDRKKDDDASAAERRQAMIENAKKEGQARKQERNKKKGEQAIAPANEANATNQWSKTDGVSQDLRHFADRYDRHKWMAAASKHFDLTGQRISPEKARELADKK